MIHAATNASAWFSSLVCEVLASGQLLPCPKEAVADTVPKFLLYCSPVQCYQVLEGSCSGPSMGLVNNSNMIGLFCSGQHGVHGFSQQHSLC